MALLNAAELRRAERAFAGGIRSASAVALFRDKGERFSEATLRKYVQLGLLPKSRRVGARGRHRGSSGLYPVGIVRQINEIKAALEAGGTLEEIRVSRVGLLGEVQVLERASAAVFGRMAEAVERQDKRRRGALKRALDQKRRALGREIRGLTKLATAVGSGGERGLGGSPLVRGRA